MDPILCNALVDFDVVGKLNPPPVKLTATVWTLSHFLRTGTQEKYAIEWTDASGTVASPAVPLNTWVQAGYNVSRFDPGAAPENCLEGSPFVFTDQRDGDSKLVTLSGNHLTITPFDSDDR